MSLAQEIFSTNIYIFFFWLRIPMGHPCTLWRNNNLFFFFFSELDRWGPNDPYIVRQNNKKKINQVLYAKWESLIIGVGVNYYYSPFLCLEGVAGDQAFQVCSRTERVEDRARNRELNLWATQIFTEGTWEDVVRAFPCQKPNTSLPQSIRNIVKKFP